MKVKILATLVVAGMLLTFWMLRRAPGLHVVVSKAAEQQLGESLGGKGLTVEVLESERESAQALVDGQCYLAYMDLENFLKSEVWKKPVVVLGTLGSGENPMLFVALKSYAERNLEEIKKAFPVQVDQKMLSAALIQRQVEGVSIPML